MTQSNETQRHLPTESQCWNICKVHEALLILSPHSPEHSFSIATISPKNDTPVGVEASLSFDPKEIGPEVTIDAFDLAILDTIYTLQLYNVTLVTDATILQTMYGCTSLDITRQKRLELQQHIQKLMGIKMRLDCTSEFRKRNLIPKKETAIFTGMMLPLEIANDGNYVITELSPIYRYAQTIRQIATIPNKLLQTDELRNSSEVLVLRRYLIKRIAAMQNKHNHMASTYISLEWWDARRHKYSGLYTYLGYDQSSYRIWRKKKYKICKMIREILAGLQAAGYISGFQELRHRDSIVKYEIKP